MSFRPSHTEYARRILTQVENGGGVSQRSLARSAGIALGLANVVLQDLIRKGYVRVADPSDGGVRYVITARGISEKVRMVSAHHARNTQFYAETRDGVDERLRALSAGWPADCPRVNGRKPIGLYGAAHAAEISYVCIQQSDLTVSAVFDENVPRRFFGMDVQPLSSLANQAQSGAFGMLVVTEFDASARARARAYLERIAFPSARVFWL